VIAVMEKRSSDSGISILICNDISITRVVLDDVYPDLTMGIDVSVKYRCPSGILVGNPEVVSERIVIGDDNVHAPSTCVNFALD